MAYPRIKLSDNSGNEVGVTDNKLDVNLGATPTIDIGDVEILGHSAVGSFALNVLDSNTAFPDNDCKHVDIMANISNTGIVYIGITGVSATTGIALYAGDVYSVNIENTQLLYALPTVDNEDINVVFYN